MPEVAATSRTPRQRVLDWFGERGWSAFGFQKRTWTAYGRGQSGLVHATTGMGKTYAAWFGPVIEGLAEAERLARKKKRKKKAPSTTNKRGSRSKDTSPPLRVLWITPLRALAADTEATLRQPVEDLGLDWTIERRTGDSSARVKSRQRKRLPTALITTPESLSLFLARKDAADLFRELRVVVLDEWHELLGTKRGVQTELCLSRLRRWHPELRAWGLSATMGDLEPALDTLMGGDRHRKTHRERTGTDGILIRGRHNKRYDIRSIVPKEIERFPWAGHLGLRLIDEVIGEIDEAESSLVFTNTRSQTESWYQQLLRKRPDWAGRIALHHGSLARDVRDWVEEGLREGSLKCVVCTSSLDLGVDFSPVDRVIQIGSPKGVARLLQRAGRSGHQPGRPSVVVCVPTHAFELVEVAAVREAARAGRIETRPLLDNPLDVLAQHAVTIAVGEGFERDELLAEVRGSRAYQNLTDEEWDWVLDFITRGGETLRAYEDYHRVRVKEGRYVVDRPVIARRHRMSIGTIVDESSLSVQYMKGGRIGTVEESFIARLRPGDIFVLAGKALELVQIQDSKVYVRRSTRRPTSIPRWMGGRMPLSNELGRALRRQLAAAAAGETRTPELRAIRPILDLQHRWSQIPGENDLLIERVKTREGWHLFFYPFEGRMVHEGLAALFAYRMARLKPITFTMAINDYGFELLSPDVPPLDEVLRSGTLFATEDLAAHIAAGLNETEMAKRQFREIARIAGLVFTGYPGQAKTSRQLQASTGLLYDVFQNYDPENPLLRQAKREVLERQLERTRLTEALDRLRLAELVLTEPARPTPLAFPLLVDRLRERLTSERLADRIRKMTLSLESEADRE